MSEDRIHDARQLGLQAADLLNNDAFRKSVDSLKQEFIDEWKRSKSPETRENCWQAINLIEKLVSALVVVYKSGDLAQKELNALLQKEETKKRRFGII